MIISFNQDPILLAIGLFMIMIFSIERYNTPPSKRYLTTAIRYYSAGIVYVAFYHLLYFLLISRPEYSKLLLKLLNQNKLSVSGQVPIAMLSAIILSIFIPKLPYISKLDLKLRKFLHTLAAIPIKALHLSSELYNSDFEIDENTKQLIKEHMLIKRINIKYFENVNKQSENYFFLKTSAAMEKLKVMQHDARYFLFFKDREDYYNRLKKRYDRLSEMALGCVSIPTKLKETVQDESIRRSMEGLYSGYKKQLNDSFREICNFISQGVLKSQLSEVNRCKFLNEIGFIGYKKKSTSFLNFHQIMMIYIILISIMLLYFIVITTQVSSRPAILIKVLMIVTTYTVSICSALYLKKFGDFFRYEEGKTFPIGGYVLTGFISVILSIPITAFFKFVAFYSQNLNLVWSFELTINELFTKYPWKSISFMTGLATSFACDLNTFIKIKYNKNIIKFRQLITGLLEGVIISVSGLFTCWLLRSTVKQLEDIPNPLHITIITFIIGFIIGLLVPKWYSKRIEIFNFKRLNDQEDLETITSSEKSQIFSKRIIKFR